MASSLRLEKRKDAGKTLQEREKEERGLRRTCHLARLPVNRATLNPRRKFTIFFSFFLFFLFTSLPTPLLSCPSIAPLTRSIDQIVISVFLVFDTLTTG